MTSSQISPALVGGDADATANTEFMYTLLDKYTRDFPSHKPSSDVVNGLPVKECILVTNCSSLLGDVVISLLSVMQEVEIIYVLHAIDATLVHHHAVPQRSLLDSKAGAAVFWARSRVRYLDATISGSDFGLSKEIYGEISRSVTHIIHIPSPLDCNSTLASYETNLRTLRNVVNFALSSPLTLPPRLIFVSSDCVFLNVDLTQSQRETFVDAKIAVGNPYGEFLWCSEQLLALASRTTSLSATTVRTGQIVGQERGAWDLYGWVPSLIKSSINLGCIPMFSESVSWMRVEDVANALIELRNTPSNLSPLHIAHPRPVSWKVLFTPLIKKYGLQPVTLSFWHNRLAQSTGAWAIAQSNDDSRGTCAVFPDGININSQTGEDTIRVDQRSAGNPSLVGVVMDPAPYFAAFFHTTNQTNLKLIRDGKSFAEAMGIPRLDITKSQTIAAKHSLGRVKAFGAEDMLRSVTYWEKLGFLPS
ncbi:hypothetical protein BC629DRAFT_1590800 [Irpex lacteus]|nr:hypothetical protein BC629DRAFT_1590800 [Irpex lacteus]